MMKSKMSTTARIRQSQGRERAMELREEIRGEAFNLDSW